ncbi:hypothetical protein [Mycolicibacterium sp. YH-1]|uniref:hypothetical protein n=1 Tax=Mycolicibacterium sp. YH-1 TaxID=2908837 RepID=UPI001F4C518E|nr:hypothetical protein [Mycolicibacterium sp. YH-1]UNB52498.1 hypothetical protein L0M16_32445 [Mycolicibacterium sp. YH-1]
MSASRRRLLVWSAPVALLLVVAIAWLCATGIAGQSAAAEFKAGVTAVADRRLPEAERHFAEAADGDPADSCPALVNLVLVRETRGDDAVAAGDGPGAIDRYRDALAVVASAPGGCFAGNEDSDAERRAVRADSANRLQTKLDRLQAPLPALPPPAAPPPPPPPAAPPPAKGPAPEQQPDVRRLDPAGGDPLDKLGQLLEDAAEVRGAP